jgi:hypothetical protein
VPILQVGVAYESMIAKMVVVIADEDVVYYMSE